MKELYYQTIPFPFEILSDSTSSMQFEWGKAQLLGYLNTWTAVKHHRETYAQDPLANITAFLNDHEKSIAVEFPLFVKIGKLKKTNVKQRHNRDMGQVFGLFKMRRLIMG